VVGAKQLSGQIFCARIEADAHGVSGALDGGSESIGEMFHAGILGGNTRGRQSAKRAGVLRVLQDGSVPR
jgi:hypothetical protein